MFELFNQNIVLDEEEFKKAAAKFSELSREMEALRKEMEELLEALAKGFDTPAGRRFMSSCKKNLLDGLKDQADVIEHVSQNLNSACSAYKSVFTEYAALNNTINSI